MKRGWVLLCAAWLGGCSEMLRWETPERPLSVWPDGDADGPVSADQYRVRPGDTLYSIAFRNQIELGELLAWNRMQADALLQPGQILRLTPPRPPAVASTPSGGIRTYPVGDVPPVVADAAPAPEVRRRLVWSWPLNGEPLRRYAPAQGSKGLDIAATVGQAVRAAAPGKVVYSGSALKGYGELIILKHDDVYLSAYGYNRRRLVKEGDSVAAGQVIAESGIGPEQKPALHFEIRERGKPINPETLLPTR